MMLRRIFLLTIGLLVVSFTGGYPVFAETIKEKAIVTPAKTISPAEESIISSAAAKVLRHIASARAAIQDRNLIQAEKDLNQADSLIDIIKASLPMAKVRDHIWVVRKHLDYGNTEEVIPALVPISSALDEIEGLASVTQVKNHLNEAKRNLEKGNIEAAKESLKAVDAALIYTEFDLPLASTEKHVIAARKMLAGNELPAADRELQSAEDRVQFVAVFPQAPITLAKKNLWRATSDYAAGDYAAAEADLKQADTYLKQAAESADETTREEVNKLIQDMVTLEGKVGKGNKENGATITNLWERSEALSKREAEHVSTGRQKLRDQNRLMRYLIEAKLHLAYAESYQFTTGDIAKAKVEIHDVEAYLKSAAEQVDSKMKSTINALEKMVDQIKADLNSNKETARARYEKIESDLRQLIHDF